MLNKLIFQTDIFSNVSSFSINEEFLVVIINNKKIYLIDKKHKIECIYESTTHLYEINYEYFFYVNERSPNKSILIKDKQLLNFESRIINRPVNENEFLCSYNGNTILQHIQKENFFQIFDFKIFKFIIYGNNIYLFKDGVVINYSLKFKGEVWKSNIPILENEKFPILSFLAINSKNIFFAINNSILILSTETGEHHKVWYEFPEVRKYYEEGNLDDYLSISHIPYSQCMMFDETSSKLIGLNSFVYWEIDTTNEEIISVNLWEEMQKHEINSINNLTEFVITPTHYIVTGQTNYDEKLNRGKDSLIAFNKDSLKIDWLHVFEKEWLGVNAPKYGAGKLYQLDNDGTLHIFEEIS